MLNLLFGGGILTKIVVTALFVALIAVTGLNMVQSGQLKLAKHKIAGLEITIVQLQTDNAILKKNVETITGVNEANVEANRKLLEERKDAQAAIEALNLQKALSDKKIRFANKRIDELLRDPKNNGELAPVLADTIKNIQGE